MQSQMYPVDVISLCSADGRIRPLRIRITDAKDRCLPVEIQQVMGCRRLAYKRQESEIFLCRAILEGELWTFELKYHLRSHSWTLLEVGEDYGTEMF